MNISFVNTDALKWISYGPCDVQRMHGFNPQGDNLFIQFHERLPDSDGTIPFGTVPLIKAFAVSASLPFEFNNINLATKCLVVAISTTENYYTPIVGSGGEGVDMTITVSSNTLCDGSEVVVGNLSDLVTHLQVWGEVDGPKKLLACQVDNQIGDIYLLFFATDAPNTGGVPLNSVKIPTGEFKTLNFGVDGYTPFEKGTDQVLRQGCDLYASSTSGVATSINPDGVTIKAAYK